LKGEDTRFDEWADIWYENHQDNIKPTTQESYKYTLRILKDHFGKRKLTEIKAMDIEQFLKKLRKDGKSDSSLAQCRGMLYQILNKAAANDLIIKNPVQYADKMRKGPPKRKESFNADEVRLLMEKLPEDKVGWSIRLMLATGMRTQELGTSAHRKGRFHHYHRAGSRAGEGEHRHRYTQILRQLSDDSCAGDGAVLRPASAGYG